MNPELERYINDHLAGSSGALLLIDRLVDTVDDPKAREEFIQLKRDVVQDRELLEELLELAHTSSSTLMKAAGQLTARMGLVKLWWEGMEPGKLGLFEAMEILALGVQGKRLLWCALDALRHQVPEWEKVDFRALEQQAIRQRDRVEHWRIIAALQSMGKEDSPGNPESRAVG